MAKARIAAALAAFWLATGAGAQERHHPLQDGATWEALRGDVVGDAEPGPADGVVDLEAPYRADDAATVPIVLRQPAGAPAIAAATIVIDENPAPVAAEIAFGPGMGPLDFEMRVRVDQYSNVRAVATTEGGEAVMAGRFVKASGGCSAPASRSPDEALAGMGEMRLREFGTRPDGRREAQVMIRHPNFSGLQRDQVTQLRVPAHFIDELEVRQGEEVMFRLTGGISLSENPVFRFAYADNGAAAFHVRAHDTEGNVFEQTLPKAPQS